MKKTAQFITKNPIGYEFSKIIIFFITLISLNFFTLNELLAQTLKVMFHPEGQTLEQIAQHIEDENFERIDIAMYSFDSAAKNPIMIALANQKVQDRIKTGTLKIRMIFEGYGDAASLKAAEKLEATGVIIRSLVSERGVHHKFGVFYNLDYTRNSLVSGSANWNQHSQNNYDENILFFDQDQEMVRIFKQQFELLWSASKDLITENDQSFNDTDIIPDELSGQQFASFFNTKVLFNSDNFIFKDFTLKMKTPASEKGYTLTKEVIANIDQAQSQILIATTRIRSWPIFQALLRAAKRGVQIDVLGNMTEYPNLYDNEARTFKDCPEEFSPKCSTGINYLFFLDIEAKKQNLPIEVRIKYYFSKAPSANLIKQMHHKYMLIDGLKLITGTFNWSYSAEYEFLENLLTIGITDKNQHVFQDYQKNFADIWNRNTDLIEPLKATVTQGKKMKCSFPPISMSFTDIDSVFLKAKKGSLKELCL